MTEPEIIRMSGPKMDAPKPIAEVNSKYSDLTIEMPSQCSFYPFDKIAVCQFSIAEQIKITRAILEEKLRFQVDAISACLGDNISAYSLTMGDFQYLLYWQRINSYKKYPLVVNWTCNNEAHLKSIETGTSATESLENSSIVERSNLQVNYIDFAECEKFVTEFHSTYGLWLYPPTIADLVSSLEEQALLANPPKEQGKITSMEMENYLRSVEQAKENIYWNKYANILNPGQHGLSLQDRRSFFKSYAETSSGLDIIKDMENWLVLCEHGVRETVVLKCKECGSTSDQVVTVDPLSFFPNNI